MSGLASTDGWTEKRHAAATPWYGWAIRLVDEVRKIAAKAGVTPGQVALAWLLSRDDLVIPIPGTKRVRYLEENVAAARVRLTVEQLAALEAAVPAGAVAGPRYDEAAMRAIGC